MIYAWICKNRAALAYVLIAAAVTVAITLSAQHTARTAARTAAVVLHDQQLASCKRGNDLRRQINMRTAQSGKSEQVLISFLRTARTARLDSFALNHAAADLKAAKGYAAEIKRESHVHFIPVAIVNCKQAFPLP